MTNQSRTQESMLKTFYTPRTLAEARRALSMRRVTGEHRTVSWHHFRTRSVIHEYPINVKPGNQLDLTVWSGIPFLRIESGSVTVTFRSSLGNSLTMAPGAGAHVIVPSADTKVTITGDTTNLTLDIPSGKHRVYWPDKYDNAPNR